MYQVEQRQDEFHSTVFYFLYNCYYTEGIS